MSLRRIRRLGALVSVAVTLTVGYAQEPLARRARDMAVSGKRGAALRMLEDGLRDDPRDVDARLIYGIVLSWEGRYDEARRALDAVLETSPDYTDAREALIRMAFWSGDPERAEAVALEGQRRNPAHTFYLLSRIQALERQHKEKEALELTRNFLQLEPGNAEAQRLRDRLEESLRKWRVSVDQFYSWFSDGYTPWQEVAVSFKGKTRIGRVGAHFSRARRFGFASQMIEFDAYPRVRPGTYLFLSGGFSPDRQLFPTYRFAGEVFQNLPRAFEGSVGFRRFNFGVPFTLYTGSLGRYFGPYLISARSFLSIDNGRPQPSIQASVRRYFGDYERFVTIRYGRGASPFEVRSFNEVSILRAHTVMAEFSGKLQGRLGYRGTVGFSVQDRTGRAALRQYILDGALDYNF